jgi:hypothetical protein
MSLARYFVFSRQPDWLVTLDGRPVGSHRSRDAALKSAIIMADLMGSMRYDADVMVEDDGRLDIAWTFGVDAVPGQPVAHAA